MNASKDDEARKQSPEKAQVRRWILKAVEDVEGKQGATTHHIQKFLDSKQEGISGKPEWKLILKKLLDSGHLKKTGGRYAVKEPKKSFGKGPKSSAASKADKKVVKKKTCPVKN